MEKEVLIKAQSCVQDFVDYLNNKSKSTLYGVIANINSFMFDGVNGLKNDFAMLLPNELSGRFAVMMWNLRDPNPCSKYEINGFKVSYIKNLLQDVINNFDSKIQEIEEEKNMNFIDVLIDICSSLQANITYRDTKDSSGYIVKVSEDKRTYYLRDMLSNKGINIKSQEHQGISENGIGSGEVDLLIYDKEQPKIYIECMNLNCLDKNYIKSHYEKLFLYDASINKTNYLISYVTVKNFVNFF